MALARSDHKRIALSIAKELQRVLADANGQRIQGKHKARVAPKPPAAKPPVDDPEMEQMMNSMDEESPAHEATESPDIEAQEEAALKKKRPPPPFARKGR